MNTVARRSTAMALAMLLFALGLTAALSPAWADSLTAGAPASSGSSSAASAKADETIPMHRLYNPYSGEHLYTADLAEVDDLLPLGWLYEGTAWEAPASSKTPVYRLYNPHSGDHHYTTSAKERDWLSKDIGWNDEGVGWYSDDEKRVTVWRLFNPYATVGTHHYTTDASEYKHLGTVGWNQEGKGWHAAKKGKPLPVGLGYNEYLAKRLNIHKALHPEFDHGHKGADRQRYIMLHDTEIDAAPKAIVDYWLKQKAGVATHFIVGKDGSVWQCVGMDRVAWHAGDGDSAALRAALPDGVMNSWSIGIEMVHVGSSGKGYPEAQLDALDDLIAYIDSYYGFESTIVDHKTWRSSNSDTSKEFARHLANYRLMRRHA